MGSNHELPATARMITMCWVRHGWWRSTGCATASRPTVRGRRPAIEDCLAGTRRAGPRGPAPRAAGGGAEYRASAGERPDPAEYRARFPGDTGLVDATLARMEVASTDAGAVGSTCHKSRRPLPRPAPARRRAAWAPSTRRSRTARAAPSPSRSIRPGLALARARSSASPRRPRSWAGCTTPASPRSTRPAWPRTASRSSPWSSSAACPWTSTPAASGLDLAARVGLLARVCDAVQHAHDQGVIHRDLKPANILVEETGQPKVLDFGVARATDADLLTAAGLTQTGQLLGTPSYMSPEQVAADPAAIDHRADVYALGVILFELAGPPPAVPARAPAPGRGRPADPGAGPAAARLDRPGTPRRRRDDRGQGAGEGPGAALPVGGGPGGGPAALAGPRADPGAAAVGAVPPAQVRPAAQGPGGRGGRHRGGPGPGARRHDPLRRRRGPAARPGRAERPGGDEKREAQFQAYRARLAAAVAALSAPRRGRRRAPARRGPGGPARLGMAAPAQPARRQLRGDPVARRGRSASCSPPRTGSGSGS